MTVSKIIVNGSNPFFSVQYVYGLMVEHTAHNGKSIGSSPVIRILLNV